MRDLGVTQLCPLWFYKLFSSGMCRISRIAVLSWFWVCFEPKLHNNHILDRADWRWEFCYNLTKPSFAFENLQLESIDCCRQEMVQENQSSPLVLVDASLEQKVTYAESSKPATALVHQLVLKRLSSRSSKDDDSNHFELEEGENWLRLLRKAGKSVLDDTQDMSQEIGAFYPSILSMNSIGGKIPMNQQDCYLCLDVDEGVLAIKDMRYPSYVGTLSNSDHENSNDDEERSTTSFPLGIARSSTKYTWEVLARRQLRVLSPGDRICTFYNPTIDLADGLVLEYRYSPKRDMSTVKDETPSGSFGLLTQPMDEDDDEEEQEDGGEEDLETQSQPNKTPSCSPEKNDTIVELGTGATNTQDDSDDDSDITRDMTQVPILDGKATKISNLPTTLGVVGEEADVDSDDETTIGESAPKETQPHDLKDHRSQASDIQEKKDSLNISIVDESAQTQDKPPEVETEKVDKQKGGIDLHHSMDEEDEQEGEEVSNPESKQAASPTLGMNVHVANAPVREVQQEHLPESAVTLSPALCNLADGARVDLPSQSVSVSMLCETGEETLLSPRGVKPAKQDEDDDDSEITDIDGHPTSKNKMNESKNSKKETSQDSDGDITDVDVPVVAQTDSNEAHKDGNVLTTPVDDTANKENEMDIDPVTTESGITNCPKIMEKAQTSIHGSLEPQATPEAPSNAGGKEVNTSVMDVEENSGHVDTEVEAIEPVVEEPMASMEPEEASSESAVDVTGGDTPKKPDETPAHPGGGTQTNIKTSPTPVPVPDYKGLATQPSREETTSKDVEQRSTRRSKRANPHQSESLETSPQVATQKRARGITSGKDSSKVTSSKDSTTEESKRKRTRTTTNEVKGEHELRVMATGVEVDRKLKNVSQNLLRGFYTTIVFIGRHSVVFSLTLRQSINSVVFFSRKWTTLQLQRT